MPRRDKFIKLDSLTFTVITLCFFFFENDNTMKLFVYILSIYYKKQ